MGIYTQLTQDQRYGIYLLLKTEMTYTDIAHAIGVHKSTVSRELRRISPALWNRIEQLVRQQWSHEQIHGQLARKQQPMVSQTWIDRYIRQDKARGGDLGRYLRCQKRRKKRYGTSDTRRAFAASSEH
jgi:IS30 family transposase